ncbi:MAG: DUF4468 domain-containing protein [Bacteroidota bacterium]|nr:DUF4468 domain-containing protein [Bacteroidota bacterium]
MVKNILLFLVFSLIFGTNSQAQWYSLRKSKPEQKQKVTFQKDQEGKIIFYEIVTVDTVSRDTLWKNARVWLRSLLTEKGDKVTSEEFMFGTLEASTSFNVFIPSVISKIPHGKISYDVILEIKDKKYRYTFTNFKFYKYKQNRQLKYDLTKEMKPLEDEKYFGSQGVWNSHRAELKRRVEGQILQLKKQIVVKNRPIVVIQDSALNKPIIRTKDW